MFLKSLVFSFFCFVSSVIFASSVEPVVVLGGGVGGLTSALYLARAGYHPIVIEGETPGGLITQSPLVENWPGEKKVSGFDLTDKIRSQVIANGAKIVSARIDSVDFSKGPLQINIHHLDGSKNPDQTIEANAAVIALGSSPRFLGVEGEKKYWGKGVSHCALCDGNLYKDKAVAVIGGKESAITEAIYLSSIAKKVFLVFRKDELISHEKNSIARLKEIKNIELIPHSKVTSMKGESELLTHIVLEDVHSRAKQTLFLDGLFLAIGTNPNTKLFSGQIKLENDGSIFLEKGQKTSQKGVFAAGDISSQYKQAIIAAGNGATAAIQAMDYLKTEGISPSAVDKVKPNRKIEKFQIVEIESQKQLQKEMSDTKIPLLIDFYATWCGPCKRISPVLEKQGEKLSGKVKILKVNVDKFSTLAKQYQIRGMPSLVVYSPDKGVLQKRVGTGSISDLLSNLVDLRDQSDEKICSYLESSTEGKSSLKAFSK